MKLKRVAWIIVLLLVAAGAATATPDWKTEFADICAHTGNATELSKDELRSLIARSRMLEPTLAKLGETERKVYSRRLEMCRNLYEYVLKSKEAEASPMP